MNPYTYSSLILVTLTTGLECSAWSQRVISVKETFKIPINYIELTTENPKKKKEPRVLQ